MGGNLISCAYQTQRSLSWEPFIPQCTRDRSIAAETRSTIVVEVNAINIIGSLKGLSLVVLLVVVSLTKVVLSDVTTSSKFGASSNGIG